MDPVRKSDRIGLLFTRDCSGTSPERIQRDPKLDRLFSQVRFWIRSKQLDRCQTVPCKQKPIRLVRFGMALRYGQNLQVQNEQYETHTNKTKIGHKISKQQKMNQTTQK